MLSALEHPQVVDDYLALEKSLGRVGAIPKHAPLVSYRCPNQSVRCYPKKIEIGQVAPHH